MATLSQISSPHASQALAELTELLGKRATAALAHREQHSAGESYHTPALPEIVCYPTSTEEVSAIVKIGAKHGLPLVPYGAGTSVEGHVNAIHGGISIDLREMNKVLRINADDMDATVEAGLTRLKLNQALNNTGLTFFIDPGADATVGGMVATRASGTTAVRYGTMRENVLALTVVLADGRIIHTGSRARKSSAGYDLTHLFIGSEGTLGVITEVTLRLHPLPEAISTAACAFPTVQAAVGTAISAIQLGVKVARIEFVDSTQVDAINKFSKTSLPLLPILFIEFHGMNQRDIDDQLALLRELAQENAGQDFQFQSSLEAREGLWKARHDAYFAALALRPGSRVLSTDVCVPISRLAECVVETKEDLGKVSFPATVLGHVGDGNFHVLCMLDPENPDDLKEAMEFSDRLVRRALAAGGTCTGEHGVGIGKMKYLDQEHGAAMEVMRAIKRALDPDNRMNPGKLVEP